MIINDLCKVKLGMDDHLKSTNVLGYPDIRISAFEILGFFQILGPCGLNFPAIMLTLGVNDHFMGADVMGYPDIQISTFRIIKFQAPVASFLKLLCSNLV